MALLLLVGADCIMRSNIISHYFKLMKFFTIVYARPNSVKFCIFCYGKGFCAILHNNL